MSPRINHHKGTRHEFPRKLIAILVTISFVSMGFINVNAATMPAGMLMPGTTPDYFGTTPNYANSPLPHFPNWMRLVMWLLAPASVNSLTHCPD